MKESIPDLDPIIFKGQFILTSENASSPKGWTHHQYQNWNLYLADLPLIDVYNEEDIWMGWCLGHPIVDNILEPEKITLKQSTNVLDPYEDFYNRTSGKWILVLLGLNTEKVFLDSFGSLSTVYSTLEKTIASTPTLLGSPTDWDVELMKELEFPDKLEWLPFGLTFKKNVKRLLPNHNLDLKEWKVSRHWPTPETDFSINKDVSSSVHLIINNVSSSIDAIIKKYPVSLTLTAGRDSRSVLACSRKNINSTTVVTFAQEKETVEMHISEKIAKQNNLNHQLLKIQKASPEEMDLWLCLTGYSVSGAIWKIHKVLKQLSPDRTLLPGLSAELHKGIKWKSTDKPDTYLSALEILKRWQIPQHPGIIKKAEDWMQELKFVNTLNLLDLFHIEQRLGCWAAPVYYSNNTSKFEVPVFNNRIVALIMMRLPLVYRRNKQLTIDICKQIWPQLLNFPFNEYPGIYGFFRAKAKKLKNFIKSQTYFF